MHLPLRESSDGETETVLARFGLDPARGFLPRSDPSTRLGAAGFEAWEEAASLLQKWLVAGRARDHLLQLPLLDARGLQTPEDVERAMLLLSYFGHAWVWGGSTAHPCLPAALAVPWHQVAMRLGRPPVLSYASHALQNWALLDPSQPVSLDNLRRLQSFLGGMDEDWFVLVHIAIEACAAPAIAGAVQARGAARRQDPQGLHRALQDIARALAAMCALLQRMPERCDPYIYYHRVRPFIFGWASNPALPQGVTYDGVDAYAGQPQFFRGETGAQSAIVPLLDETLGVRFRPGPFLQHLTELRDYMPSSHRALIRWAAAEQEQLPLRDIVLRCGVVESYNGCLDGLCEFRALHHRFAARYIHAQSAGAEGNPTGTGTGGTPFMRYLAEHIEDTRAARLEPVAGRS
jgi:indoleamine 2,3-dioxygenase